LPAVWAKRIDQAYAHSPVVLKPARRLWLAAILNLCAREELG
jgi:hypothetical protein